MKVKIRYISEVSNNDPNLRRVVDIFDDYDNMDIYDLGNIIVDNCPFDLDYLYKVNVEICMD